MTAGTSQVSTDRHRSVSSPYSTVTSLLGQLCHQFVVRLTVRVVLLPIAIEFHKDPAVVKPHVGHVARPDIADESHVRFNTTWLAGTPRPKECEHRCQEQKPHQKRRQLLAVFHGGGSPRARDGNGKRRSDSRLWIGIFGEVQN